MSPPPDGYVARPPEGAPGRLEAARRSVRPIDVDLVVHTHWDREWYMDRETTLARLLAVMTQVVDQLDIGTLESFLFDGQTVALRDLLSVASPEMTTRLRAHAASGRLVLGPWYVSADEFLVSGESLVRNLEFGIADATAFGPVQRIGYIVDTFGHATQMPQLLAQFGIHHAVLWRGADAVHDRFDWVAPDGTRVHTALLTQGYYLNPLHGPQWQDHLPHLLDKLAARRAPGDSGPLLLMHGGDHLAPSPMLAARIAAFNAAQGHYRLRTTTLSAHVQRSGAASEVLHGELRHNVQAFVLPDVLSTRRHLKLAHQQLEDRLLGEIEPLAAMLSTRPAEGIERAWRTLIEQQAHDSICGCSTDAVHDEMAQRFVSLGQQLDAMRHALCVRGGLVTAHRFAAGAADAPAWDVFADDTRFTLFNPLPQRREGWWLVTLFLRGDAPTALRLTGADGAEVASQLIDSQAAAELVSPLDDAPERLVGHRLSMAVFASLPGLGGVELAVHSGGFPPAAAVVSTARSIANAAWSVECKADGQIALTDQRAGTRSIEGVFELLAELDAGDSYNFSPPPQPHAASTARWHLIEVRTAGVVREMRLNATLDVPASLNAARTGRSSETVAAHATLHLRLIGDEPVLRAHLRWQHSARDCRVRLLFPGFGDEVRETLADSAFALVARPVRLVQIPDAPSRQEMPVAVLPSLGTVIAGPWTVVHRAMHEHEIVAHGSERALGVTLVRGVGWLSRRDLRTRGVGAGPDIETPGAQCLGEHVFDFHLVATEPGTDPAQALAHAADLRRPPLLLRGHARATKPAIDIGNRHVATSSVRRLADGMLELRLWNPSGRAQPLQLDTDAWQAIYADGRGLADAAGPITLRPHAILTLRERRGA